jgi:hypothetical protein
VVVMVIELLLGNQIKFPMIQSNAQYFSFLSLPIHVSQVKHLHTYV